MKQDPNLIRMMDSGGALPLEYVRKEQYGARNSFLASILDIYLSPPPLALERANSWPAADPEHALSLELAALVSCGRMEPEVAIEVQSEAEGDDDDETESFSDGESSYDDELDFAELAELRQLAKFSAMAA
jgi:hypothetical protein